MTMGTRIVVMKAGVIQQIAKPQTLYDYPANVFVASFIGTPQMNFFDAVLDENGLLNLSSGQTIQLSPDKRKTLEAQKGTREVVLGIRPEDITLCSDDVTENAVTARVDVIEALGGEALLYCSLNLNEEDKIVTEDDKNTVVAKIGARESVARGQLRRLHFDQSRIHLFDKATERTLTIAEAE